MKSILIFVITTLYVVSLSATPLFNRCAVCHGAKGEKSSLNLTGIIAGMKASSMVKILKKYKASKRDKYGYGRMMKGQTVELSLADMKEIASYVESFPLVKKVKYSKTKKMSAKEMFKKCSICHGAKGEKKSLGVSKIIAGMKADDTIKELQEYKLGKKSLYGYGNMMRGQTSRLSQKEIIKIAKYIESLPVVNLDNLKKKPARKITKQELDFNAFMDAYFRNSKDPNETFKAAKKKYKQHTKTKENK